MDSNFLVFFEGSWREKGDTVPYQPSHSAVGEMLSIPNEKPIGSLLGQPKGATSTELGNAPMPTAGPTMSDFTLVLYSLSCLLVSAGTVPTASCWASVASVAQGRGSTNGVCEGETRTESKSHSDASLMWRTIRDGTVGLKNGYHQGTESNRIKLNRSSNGEHDWESSWETVGARTLVQRMVGLLADAHHPPLGRIRCALRPT